MNTCSGCDAQWTALGACHCRACHVTKDDLAAWDKHRMDGECSRRRRVAEGAPRRRQQQNRSKQ